jgi:hypothetical protein
MHGNIGEWCLDEFPAAPNVPNGAVQHAVRGGSFGTPTQFRQTSFIKTYPLSYGNDCGLRLVRVPVGKAGTTASVTPQPATSSKLFMHDPAFPQWLKDVQAMPADEQIKAVWKKMKELNPRFDKNMPTPNENGVVTNLQVLTNDVTDISPLRALAGLRDLNCAGKTGGKGKLFDLSPLFGISLTKLYCDNTQVSDLSPLRGMPLTVLSCHFTPVSDLSPLHECKNLTSLNITSTKVTPAAIAALQKALPNCQIEWDDSAKPSTTK